MAAAGRGGHTGFTQGHGARGSLSSLNWGEDTNEDAVSDPKFRPHLEVPEGQTAHLGEDQGDAHPRESVLDANEAFGEAWAGSRTWTGRAALSADPAGGQAGSERP